VYPAEVVRRAIAGVVLGAAAQACYSGGFLDDTCERLPAGCVGTTAVGSSSGGDQTTAVTTVTPTTGDATTTGLTTDATSSGSSGGNTTEAPPGVLFDGPAFRVDTLSIVDPHLYLKAFACSEVQSFINTGLTKSIDDRDTNLILLARNYDPAAATQEFYFYRDADCPPGEDYCLLIDAVPPTVFVSFNRDEANCLDVAIATVNPAHVNELNIPVAPCVVSPTASLPIQLSADLDPITFYLGQFAAQYDMADTDPVGLKNALLYGFIPKADANTINYNYEGVPINLWSVVRGGDHPDACPVPADGMPGSVSDVDLIDLDPNDAEPAIEGVFLYLNFTAEKIDFYAPPP
jgi:hypothetical protein